MTDDTIVVEIRKINESRNLRGVRPIPAELMQRYGQIQYVISQAYKAAIIADKLETIVFKLNTLASELRGFAYEGVGMALTQRDIVTPSQQSLVETFVTGLGVGYENFVYVGVGLMLGKQSLSIKPYLESLNSPKCWPILDGFGFQNALIHWRDYLENQSIPEDISGYTCRAFDQGMGRGIWFLDGGDVTRISKTIGAFPPARQRDLWCGLAYACSYAGGVDHATLEALKTASASYQPILARSVAMAAKSRQLLGNSSIYTERACKVFCGMRVEEAAETVDRTIESLLTNSTTPEQEDWLHYRYHLMRLGKTALPV